MSAKSRRVLEGVRQVGQPRWKQSNEAPEVTHTYSSLWDVAQELADSRIYGGIHYRFDATAGLELGQRVAERALRVERAGRLLAAFR